MANLLTPQAVLTDACVLLYKNCNIQVRFKMLNKTDDGRIFAAEFYASGADPFKDFWGVDVLDLEDFGSWPYPEYLDKKCGSAYVSDPYKKLLLRLAWDIYTGYKSHRK